MIKAENSGYKTFEITISSQSGTGIEYKRVSRITFQEAARDAYLMICTGCHTKSITSIRILE